jgi:hypothetical protein
MNPQPHGVFTVSAESTIQAPLARVWDALTDLDHYADWNTFVPSMRSAFKVGDTLTMRVQMNRLLQVSIAETITVIDHHRQLAWRTKLPKWAVQSTRYQTLTPIDVNITHYHTSETFYGVLAALVRLLFENDLNRGFTAVAEGLKEYSERGTERR